MGEASRTRQLSAPPEAVWAVLAEFDRIAEWAPNVDHSCALTDQRDGVGAVRRVQVGRPALLETVVAWEPNVRLAYRLDGLPVPARIGAVTNEWRLEPSGGGHHGHGDIHRRCRQATSATADRSTGGPQGRRRVRHDARRAGHPSATGHQCRRIDPMSADSQDRPDIVVILTDQERAIPPYENDALSQWRHDTLTGRRLVRRARRQFRPSLHRIAGVRTQPPDDLHRAVPRRARRHPDQRARQDGRRLPDAVAARRVRCPRSATGSAPAGTTPTTTASGTSAMPT